MYKVFVKSKFFEIAAIFLAKLNVLPITTYRTPVSDLKVFFIYLIVDSPFHVKDRLHQLDWLKLNSLETLMMMHIIMLCF